MPGQTAQRLHADFAADGVDDDIHAGAICQRLNERYEVVLSIVDDVLGAPFGSDRAFLERTGGRDHGCAQRPSDLHRCETDTTGSSVHKDGLTGLHLR